MEEQTVSLAAIPAGAGDAQIEGNYAWICTKCYARAAGWQGEAIAVGDLLDNIAARHARVSRGKCQKPEIIVASTPAYGIALLTTPAADIERLIALMKAKALVVPEPRGSEGRGPWARPDMFGGRAC